MKVFISWSGDRSKRTAKLLAEWLPELNNDIKPFVSDDDIAKGGDWNAKIRSELSSSEFGIVCVTLHNSVKPWILFEAGALSKQVNNVTTRVAPLLIGFPDHVELPPPMGLYQTTRPTYDDMFKLVLSLNETCPLDRQRDMVALTKAFGVWWDKFEKPFEEIQASVTPSKIRPPEVSEVVNEILQVVRGIQKNINQTAHTGSTFSAMSGQLGAIQRRLNQAEVEIINISSSEDVDHIVQSTCNSIGLTLTGIKHITMRRIEVYVRDSQLPDMQIWMNQLAHELRVLGISASVIRTITDV